MSPQTSTRITSHFLLRNNANAESSMANGDSAQKPDTKIPPAAEIPLKVLCPHGFPLPFYVRFNVALPRRRQHYGFTLFLDTLQHSIRSLWLRVTPAGVPPACHQTISSPHVHGFIMQPGAVLLSNLIVDNKVWHQSPQISKLIVAEIRNVQPTQSWKLLKLGNELRGC